MQAYRKLTKMIRFPLLGEQIQSAWNVRLTSEFHMTADSDLFKPKPFPGSVPLYEGKMIHQFTGVFARPRYWVSMKEARPRVLGNTVDTGQRIESDLYRLAFRSIGRNTDERTMISALLPPSFLGNSLSAVRILDQTSRQTVQTTILAYLCAIWNSFLIDYFVRAKVAANLNFFYVYQLPVPRLTEKDPAFKPIVDRAAKLICTTPRVR